MNFDEFEQAPCIVPPVTSEGQCAGTDSRCLDLEWSADHPDTCPDAPTITGLKVTPVSGTVDVGGTLPYTATLQFSNGGSKDVTNAATWETSDGSIAGIVAGGVATGIADGTTTVSATYRDLVDFAQITVVSKCVQAGMDIVLVFDRSAGMTAVPDVGRPDYLELAKRASRALVDSAVLTSGKDSIAVVSCAGYYRDQASPAYRADARLHLRLSSVQEDILAAIDSIQFGNCYFDVEPGIHASECATGIGGGLQKAKQELIDRGREGSRKLIVYIGNGYEVYCTPDPVTEADDIEARNWLLAGIVTGEAITHHPCSSGTPLGEMTTWQYVQSLVKCDLFWGVEDLDTLPNAFAEVLHTICDIQNDGCVYYVAPIVNPPPVQRYRDQLDYFGLVNWDVIKGFVDLIGIDLWPLQPGYGLFLDMVGTDQDHGIEGIEAVGAIQSKQLFTFNPGRYRLTFDLAGNLRFDSDAMQMKITIGSALAKIVTVNDWQMPFTTYTFDFSVTSGLAANVVFEHMPLPKNAVKTVGLLLDNVRLENLDSGEVLLEDDFNSENPI